MTTLRPLLIFDAPMVQLHAADIRIARSAEIPHPYPKDAGFHFCASSMIMEQDARRISRVIEQDGEFAGLVGVYRMPDWELGYWVIPDLWHRGIGSEAVRLFMAELEARRITEIRSRALECNEPSIRILEKNGFRAVGEEVHENPNWPVTSLVLSFKYIKNCEKS